MPKWMKTIHSYVLLSIEILCIVVLSCKQSPQQPDVQIYTFPSPEKQPIDEPESNASISPLPQENKEKYVERNIVVTEQNSIFSIGIPAGSTEKTEVITEKPIDFWFEYLTADAKLKINGVEVKRDHFHWETKIGYSKSVTKFSYQIFNTTDNYISYNLHMVPSVAGETVPVVVRQRWIP